MDNRFILNIDFDLKEKQDQPIYRKLYDHFRKMILQKQLKPGTRLPASRELAKDLSISRNTVTESYSLLQADGFITSRTGAGYFVTDDLEDNSFILHVATEQDANISAPKIAERAQVWVDLHNPSRHLHNTMAFAPGRPALEEFPYDIWARLLSRRWRLNGARLSMEEDPAGYQPLRAQIAQHLHSSRAVNCDADQILIVSGAQQGLDLIGRVLWDKGDDVVLEDPVFSGINGVVEGAGAKLHAVSIDEEGLDAEKCAALYPAIKTFLVTPSRNYPLGVTMSLARRLSLLKVAKEKSAWIVEDDFDSDFRFDGRPLSCLQGLDQDGRVIYVGSFSRILFPALRLGFLVLPKSLVLPFHAAKAYVDGHTSILSQAVLADFFIQGYYASHLRRMRKLYRERRQYLLNRLDEDFHEELHILPSDGGLHICVAFNKPRDDVAFALRLAGEGVTVRPLSRFYKNETKKYGFLLGFAGYSETEMARGLDKIREILPL
jgi:GntR family transcriptional regulator / MocR family aminotransferase